jgi:predicted permease
MGRDFDNRDRKGSQGVAVINQRFASYYWPGQSPIGKFFRWGGGREVEIVGLVKNTKYQTIRKEPQLIFYLPVSQLRFEELTLLVRTGNRASETVARICNVVHRLDPKLPIYDVKTLETQIDLRLSQERILASLSMFFSASATLLAAVGLYGVVAYSVKRRFREIGIRVALGARPSDIGLLFLRESLVMVVAGLAIGAACAFAAARYLASLLYGLSQNDTIMLAAVSLLLLLVNLIAVLVPARKATRIDPMAALRHE